MHLQRLRSFVILLINFVPQIIQMFLLGPRLITLSWLLAGIFHERVVDQMNFNCYKNHDTKAAQHSTAQQTALTMMTCMLPANLDIPQNENVTKHLYFLNCNFKKCHSRKPEPQFHSIQNHPVTEPHNMYTVSFRRHHKQHSSRTKLFTKKKTLESLSQKSEKQNHISFNDKYFG